MIIPPLGIIPRYIFLERRLTNIDDAIERYTKAGLPYPPEWVTERNEIIAWLQRREAAKES